MATTLMGFVANSQGVLITPSNASKANVQELSPYVCSLLANSGTATRLDSQVDLSGAGYAKNGAFVLSLAISTPLTVDLTAIASVATASAGDNSFATIYDVQLTNLGPTDVVVGAAGSTPALLEMGGTTPTITIPANGGVYHLKIPAGLTTTSANNLKFSSGASAAQIGMAIGGA
jgi:hypothetical protein